MKKAIGYYLYLCFTGENGPSTSVVKELVTAKGAKEYFDKATQMTEKRKTKMLCAISFNAKTFVSEFAYVDREVEEIKREAWVSECKILQEGKVFPIDCTVGQGDTPRDCIMMYAAMKERLESMGGRLTSFKATGSAGTVINFLDVVQK